MPNTHTATARAFSNIAFIKYWGNRDDVLRLPSNGSISMNLDGLQTTTRVAFDPALSTDSLTLNGKLSGADAGARVSQHLDRVRALAGVTMPARVDSTNNFPTGAGIASSASAFAALTVAAAGALELALDEAQLSALARLGSGSACRSVPAGFTEWDAGTDHLSSYAHSIAPPDYWDLVDLVAIVSREHKAVGSSGGHRLAATSPLQAGRLMGSEQRVIRCRQAILERDFEALTAVVEEDTLLMHAVMMSSTPRLIYWRPATLTVIEATEQLRADGVPAFFTIDAGANVHVITLAAHAEAVSAAITVLPGVETILSAQPGGPAVLIDE